jgi:2-keto-4-pentenoate hydratase/2-oxohepta-3-ene-1,7-dioic acid hydratase in catechol pathway
MKFLSYAHAGQQSWGAVRGDRVVDIGESFRSLRHMIASDGMAQAIAALEKAGEGIPLSEIDYLPPIAKPDKIMCIGVNYRNRNAEYKDGSDEPRYPSLFMRTPGSLTGHGQALRRPPESEQLDYEGEIVIVIGKAGRRISEADAEGHVFGLALMNEGTIRDWLRHGKFNVTQGKNFASSGAIGPWIVTRDEIGPFDGLEIITRVNGEERQHGFTRDLMFSFRYIVAYLSTFMELLPGDIIATGTPPGAGARFDPPRWLVPGDVVEVSSPGIGILSNRVKDEVV